MLKKLRIARNTSQRELSRNTGISQGYLSKIEARDTSISPTIRFICKISAALEVSPYKVAKYFIDKELDE